MIDGTVVFCNSRSFICEMLLHVGGLPLRLVWMEVMGVPGYRPVVQKFSFFKTLL